MKEKKKKSKYLIWTILSPLLAILTIRVVLKQSRDISIDDLISAIGSSNKGFFLLSAIAAALYVWFEGIAIRSILKKFGYKRSSVKGLLYTASDIYFSAITPSATGGQPASAFFMIRDGIPTGIATATLILNLMTYTISIIVLGIMAVIISPTAFTEFSCFSQILIAIGVVTFSVLTLFFFVLMKNEELIFKPLSKIISFLYDKKLIKEKEHKLSRLEKINNDYKMCSEMISVRKSVLLSAFFWNFLQRASQLLVPMLIFASLGGDKFKLAEVFSKQCLITVGYNFIPIPGGMGISDYLMIDGFSRVMGEQTAYTVEMISRGITFYLCVSVSGIITLIGYFAGKVRR